VTRDEIAVSPIKPFVIPAPQGYAVGFSFNLTNMSGCELRAESIHVTLRDFVYPSGNSTALGLSENGQLDTTMMPKESAPFSYAFNSYFDSRPAELLLKIEITFTGAGTITIFDGEVSIPTP
jgi:hypothetical protein